MITLAFDTALDKMYVVLRKDGKTTASKIVETTQSRYHSADLIPTIKEILGDIKPQEIDLIATNIGPGSFTGIRACVTVARTMAQQLGCKAVGVSSLDILSKLNTTDKPILVVGKRHGKRLVAVASVQKIRNPGAAQPANAVQRLVLRQPRRAKRLHPIGAYRAGLPPSVK